MIRNRRGPRSLWLPDAVITGPAAAWLSFWPEITVPLITLSLPVRRPVRTGFTGGRWR